MTDTPSVANVLSVFERATADNLRFGLTWYNDAHRFCQTVGGGRVHHVARNAGIVAALSPMNGWENNKRKAAQLISQRGNGAGCGLFRNVAKAAAIYNGAEPLDILGGDKVRAFYATILNPTGDVRPVIDRHAFDIAVGERTSEKRRGILSRNGVYEAFADAYREAATIVGIGAPQMQAATWLQWRTEHNISA